MLWSEPTNLETHWVSSANLYLSTYIDIEGNRKEVISPNGGRKVCQGTSSLKIIATHSSPNTNQVLFFRFQGKSVLVKPTPRKEREVGLETEREIFRTKTHSCCFHFWSLSLKDTDEVRFLSIPNYSVLLSKPWKLPCGYGEVSKNDLNKK